MKKQLYAVTTLLFAFPIIASAQTIQILIANVQTFLSKIILPFLFGLAFLVFIINVIRFFVIGGSNEDGQKKAKALAIYSVAAFVLLILFWGIVNLFSNSIGLGGKTAPANDYVELKAKTCPIGTPGPC